jgi:hypothetical protein
MNETRRRWLRCGTRSRRARRPREDPSFEVEIRRVLNWTMLLCPLARPSHRTRHNVPIGAMAGGHPVSMDPVLERLADF